MFLHHIACFVEKSAYLLITGKYKQNIKFLVSNERDGGYFLGMITNPIIKKEKSYNPRYVFHCAYLTQANPYRPI